MNKIKSFVKREAMFVIALLFALLSFIITPPSPELLLAINWKTLALLFMLFTVLEGFKREHMLDAFIQIATRIKKPYVLSIFLVIAVFIISAFITNDVALLAFVPITIAIFKKAERDRYTISVVALETIAANLGSMLTPFGNPQNLYLFDKLSISGSAFMLFMAPLSCTSLGLLILAITFVFRHDLKDEIILRIDNDYEIPNKGLRMFYFCLFIFTLIAVLSNIPWLTMLVFFLLLIVSFDRSILKNVDWLLLATFLCFFVFSTNLASNERIKVMLGSAVASNELLSGVLLSQVISNVPAAILLEPFATNLKALTYGVDIGGLGTLVASLASLISFRLYAKSDDGNKSSYLLSFTIWNVIFLLILYPIAMLLLK